LIPLFPQKWEKEAFWENSEKSAIIPLSSIVIYSAGSTVNYSGNSTINPVGSTVNSIILRCSLADNKVSDNKVSVPMDILDSFTIGGVDFGQIITSFSLHKFQNGLSYLLLHSQISILHSATKT
jgi:hypothetical protein